jgi:hypothetical protein
MRLTNDEPSFEPYMIDLPLILSHRRVIQPQKPLKPGETVHRATAASVVKIARGDCGFEGRETTLEDPTGDSGLMSVPVVIVVPRFRPVSMRRFVGTDQEKRWCITISLSC